MKQALKRYLHFLDLVILNSRLKRILVHRVRKNFINDRKWEFMEQEGHF